MKRWKAATLSIFVCLNFVLCFFTVSLVYRKHSSVHIHQNDYGSEQDSPEKHRVSTLHPSISHANARESSVARSRLDHMHMRANALPQKATYNSASSPTKQDQSRLASLHYTLTPNKVHCTSGTKLLIAVCSSLDNFDRREAIRSTWGNRTFLEHFNVSVVFIVALPRPENQYLQDYLFKEYINFGDIVQLNHTDHYKNLSLKSMGMLLWTVEHCRTVRYLLKTDDDVFVNVPNLVNLLGEKSYADRSGFILGSIIQAAQPVRNRLSKWFTPESVYRYDSYPLYASGTAYLISQDVVTNMCSLMKNRMHSIFWLEDVFLTGILAKDLDVELIHDDRFNFQKKRRNPCWYSTAFTEHDQSPEDLLKIWNFAQVNSELSGLQWTGCQTNSTLLL